jgi:cystathionine beta-lyase
VLHPALPGAPGHAIWRRDFTGAAGLFSVVLRPGGDVDALLDKVELFGLGYSWGGFESLVIPCDPQLKSRSLSHDYGGPLVRFHIGLESAADLKDDLAAGLKAYG